MKTFWHGRWRYLGLIVLAAIFPINGSAEIRSEVKEGEYVVVRVPYTSAASPPAKALRAPYGAAAFHVDLITEPSPGTAAPQAKSLRLSQSGRVVPYDAGRDRCAEIQKRDPSIVACSPNFVRRLFQSIPDDPFFSQQWGLKNADQHAGAVNALNAWPFSVSAESVVIGVVDGGVDLFDPELAPNLWVNEREVPGNGLDDDRNGYIDDVHGADTAEVDGNPFSSEIHGNHVMGIIGARGNNRRGISGVAWNAKLLPVKAADDTGGLTTHSFARAVDYLLTLKQQQGIRLVAVNASFGGYNFSQVEYMAVQALRDAGVLLVAAAGNEANNNDAFPVYPASYLLDNVISVAAVDRNGDLAPFSNFGLLHVDIAAPGSDVLSTAGTGRYAYLDGTSMAAPFVSGAAALVAALAPDRSAAAIRKAIFDSARPSERLSGFLSTGRMLNLEAALGYLSGIPLATASGLPAMRNRNAEFSLEVHQLGQAVTDSVRPRSKVLLRLAARNPNALLSEPGMMYLSFRWDRVRCPAAVQIDQIVEPELFVSGTPGRVKNRADLTVIALNGEGMPMGKVRVKVRRPSSAAGKKNAVNAKRKAATARRRCRDFLNSLQLQSPLARSVREPAL